MQDKRTEKSKKTIAQYKRVFSTSDGRAVLYDMMKANFILDATPFVPGNSDITFRNLGKQEFVKQIMFMLKMDPEEFFKLTQENEEDHV